MGHFMTIGACIAGATGWVGQALVKEILGSNQFTLAGAISRSAAGQDIPFTKNELNTVDTCWSRFSPNRCLPPPIRPTTHPSELPQATQYTHANQSSRFPRRSTFAKGVRITPGKSRLESHNLPSAEELA